MNPVDGNVAKLSPCAAEIGQENWGFFDCLSEVDFLGYQTSSIFASIYGTST